VAKKALFHKIIITTGHGSGTYIFSTQRKDSVINALQTNSDKVVVESSTWFSVQSIIF